MYNQIQDILTYLIEAIAIIGFLFCWLHYCATTTLIEIRSWGTPQSFPDSTIKNELNSIIVESSQSFCDELSIIDANQPKNQLSTFQDYSKTRLRKIARELKIRRYSRMEMTELITAIANHPEVQRVCT